MKANELRIGNYVYDTEQEKVDIITAIELEGRVSLKDSYYPYTPIDDIAGIPITEQWIEDFGFNKINKWYYEKNNLIFILTAYSLKFNYGCIIDIKYIHQLQNLFFALFGKELNQ